MQNLAMHASLSNMDHYFPELCFCGNKTVESHSHWFCSTVCARQDSLRSLDDPECHYRNIVRKAHLRAGILELYPRRMMSADHLRPAPSQQRHIANSPFPFSSPTNPSHKRRDVHDRHMAGLPTLSQVTNKVISKKAEAGEPLEAARQDRPRWEGFPYARLRARPAQRPQEQEHTFEQISLDAIPLQERIPVCSLRRVPTNDSLKSNIRTSIAALLNPGRSRKGKDGEDPEIAFGHPVDTIVPPMGNESSPSHHQQSFAADPARSSKALRRSASFAGWDKTPHNDPFSGHDMIMHIIEEMREDDSGSFDPRSLFDLEEPY